MNRVKPDGPKRNAVAGASATAQPFSAKQRLLLVLAPPVAAVLLRLLCLTLRFQTKAEAGAYPADCSAGPDIYAFWHRCLLLAAYRYRGLGIHILISQSFDGELIARTVERLGFVPVRGSSSRGGAAGLLALSRAVAAGRKVAITVDGPRGPKYVAKPGAASVALREARAMEDGSGVRISPFHLHPESAWTLRSWDAFLIPKPFSRVFCAWTEPVSVAPQASLEQVNDQLQQALTRAVSSAEAS